MIAAIVICSFLALSTLAFSVVPIIIGKVKRRRALRPVDYYPPRGYSPVDVLIKYYGYRANAHELINPLMLYWADRGFITIEEDCKRGLKLTKLREIEQLDQPIADVLSDSYDFDSEFLKELDFDTEKKLFDNIFKFDKVFYTLAAKSEHLGNIDEFIKDCKENAQTVKTKLTKKLSIAALIYSVFAAVAATITVAAATGGGPRFLPMIFPLVGMIAFRAVPNEGLARAIKYPFFAVWAGAPFSVVLSLIEPWAIGCLGVPVLVSALTISVFSGLIDIRSKTNNDIYGRIMAFKTFLLDAEIDRLETLVEEDPDYFYNILPYCYILKITEKLKPKFDRIALDGPSWYLGDLRNTLMF